MQYRFSYLTLEMSIRHIIWTALLFLTGPVQSYASHISGAEITYKHVFGNTYQFKLKVYRDCRECKFNNSGGGDNSNNCNDVPNLSVTGAAGTSYSTTPLASIEISRIAIQDVTPSCYTGISKCRPGSNMALGYEVHLFEGTFNFTDLINNGYCKFDVSVGISSRSANINTQMSEQPFFNYAMINLCEGKPNASVEYKAAPQFVHSLNQSVYIASGVENGDGDSLSFALKPALVSRNRSVSYATGRSSDAPFSYYCSVGSSCAPNIAGAQVEGFYCSRSTGDIAFTPTQINQGGVVLIECEEWKKNNSGVYYLAGVTRRDVYGDVVSTTNNLPVLKNKVFDFTICEGDDFALEINAEDIPLIGFVNDTVFAEITTTMPGVYLDRIPLSSAPYYRHVLRVESGPGQIGKHLLTLSLRDNHCALNGSISRTFSIDVIRSRQIQIASSVRNCGVLEAYSVNFSNRNIFWSIRDMQQNVLKQQLSRKISLQLVNSGDYIVEAYLPAESGFCEARFSDTVHAGDFTQPVIDVGPDLTVCKGTSVSITPRNFKTYDDFTIYADGIQLKQFPYVLELSSVRTVEFKVEQINGCNAADKLNLALFPQLNYSVRNDTACINAIFPMTVRNIQTNPAQVNLISYTYSGTSSAIERVTPLEWHLKMLNYQAHKATLYSLIQDKNNCLYADTSFIDIIAPEPVKVECPDKVCINAAPIALQTDKGGAWECVNYPQLVRQNMLIPDGIVRNNLVMKYTETRLCSNSKTFNIQPLDSTPIAFGHDRQILICEDNGPYELKGLPAGGVWKGEHVLNPFFNPDKAAGKTHKPVYVYTNSNNCKSESSVQVSVEKLPLLKVQADKERLCVGELLTLQALSSVSDPGYWYTDGDGSFEKPVNVITTYTPRSTDVAKGVLRFSYTLQTNGVCGNVSSYVFVRVKNGPSGNILKTYPASVCEPAVLTFKSDFNGIEKQHWFVNDSLAETFDYNFDFTTMLKAGDYVIKTKVYDSTCEALAISETITVLPKPAVQMASNPDFRISREYPRLYLKDLSYNRNGHSVNWYFNNTWISDSREFYYTADDSKDSFHIKLLAKSDLGGCKDSLSRLFVFIPINQLYIPDAFSPDAKGPEENNRFRIRGPEMRVFEIEIFNRFGEKVFVSDNMQISWDGTYRNEDCMPGVYFYKIISTDYEGISRDYSGTVTLIR
jgi:gliding motility-associated-like protein